MGACKHPDASTVVWNDLADVNHDTGEIKVAGRLTVAWCPDCGAIKRDFPAMFIDWEIPETSRRGRAAAHLSVAELQRQLAVAHQLLTRCAHKLGYLVRDYPSDKESRGLIEQIAELETPPVAPPVDHLLDPKASG